MGVDFTVCDPIFLCLAFEKCLLNGCNFTAMQLKEMQMVECIIKECHFAECNLEKSNFTRSNLEGSLFHHSNLLEANFSEATNYQIDPLNNAVKGAKFSTPEALSLLGSLGIKIE